MLSYNISFSAALRMENQTDHFRHIIFSYSKKSKNASQSARKMYTVYRQNTISDDTVRRLFEKFKCMNISLKDNADLYDYYP